MNDTHLVFFIQSTHLQLMTFIFHFSMVLFLVVFDSLSHQMEIPIYFLSLQLYDLNGVSYYLSLNTFLQNQLRIFFLKLLSEDFFQLPYDICFEIFIFMIDSYHQLVSED